MASRHPRIQVPNDPELQRAISRAREIAAPRAPESQIVRALALRGAEALEVDEYEMRQAREFLVQVAEGTSGIDLERLRTTRERAWR